ncbi:MAG: hypothetical protein BWY66_02624 [bacterium ADurb.Bin374]|nr:MAG: hypothetical protein BWY66_02624 [bacterium ADurb.Bin374]
MPEMGGSPYVPQVIPSCTDVSPRNRSGASCRMARRPVGRAPGSGVPEHRFRTSRHDFRTCPVYSVHRLSAAHGAESAIHAPSPGSLRQAERCQGCLPCPPSRESPSPARSRFHLRRRRVSRHGAQPYRRGRRPHLVRNAQCPMGPAVARRRRSRIRMGQARRSAGRHRADLLRRHPGRCCASRPGRASAEAIQRRVAWCQSPGCATDKPARAAEQRFHACRERPGKARGQLPFPVPPGRRSRAE